MTYRWDERILLEYSSMLLSSYSLMDHLARLDWYHRIRRDMDVATISENPGGGCILTLKYLRDFTVEVGVQAMWQAAQKLKTLYGPEVRRLFAGINLSDQPVAILQYNSWRRTSQTIASDMNGTISLRLNGTSDIEEIDLGPARNAPAKAVSAPWPEKGEVISQEDSRLRVLYSYDEVYGGAGIFESLMEALANAAPHTLYDAFESMAFQHEFTGPGTFATEFQCWRDSKAPPRWQFTYKIFIQALKILWGGVITGLEGPYRHPSRFTGVYLGIVYDGNFIGQGFVKENSPSSLSIATS